MRFCEECGAQLEDHAKFCEECGAVNEIPVAAVPQMEYKPEQTSIPVNTSGEAPVTKNTAPVVNNTTPTENNTAPTENNAAPTENNAVPTEKKSIDIKKFIPIIAGGVAVIVVVVLLVTVIIPAIKKQKPTDSGNGGATVAVENPTKDASVEAPTTVSVPSETTAGEENKTEDSGNTSEDAVSPLVGRYVNDQSGSDEYSYYCCNYIEVSYVDGNEIYLTINDTNGTFYIHETFYEYEGDPSILKIDARLPFAQGEFDLFYYLSLDTTTNAFSGSVSNGMIEETFTGNVVKLNNNTEYSVSDYDRLLAQQEEQATQNSIEASKYWEEMNEEDYSPKPGIDEWTYATNTYDAPNFYDVLQLRNTYWDQGYLFGRFVDELGIEYFCLLNSNCYWEKYGYYNFEGSIVYGNYNYVFGSFVELDDGFGF